MNLVFCMKCIVVIYLSFVQNKTLVNRKNFFIYQFYVFIMLKYLNPKVIINVHTYTTNILFFVFTYYYRLFWLCKISLLQTFFIFLYIYINKVCCHRTLVTSFFLENLQRYSMMQNTWKNLEIVKLKKKPEI